MSKTVILINPMGTDVTPWVNGSLGSWKLLKGSILASGDSLYTLPYNNKSGIGNVQAAVPVLHAKILDLLAHTSDDIEIVSYSEGGQVADLWITQFASSGIGVGRISFLSLANANSKYGGFAYNHPEFNKVGFTGGLPATVPWPYKMFSRQYDGISDFPTDKTIQQALTSVQAVANGTTSAAQPAMAAAARVLINTSKWKAIQNAMWGAIYIHNWYFDVAPGDAGNTTYTSSSGVVYELAPTFPVPLLGTGVTDPAKDASARTAIEACFARPMTTPAVKSKNFGFGLWGQG